MARRKLIETAHSDAIGEVLRIYEELSGRPITRNCTLRTAASRSASRVSAAEAARNASILG